MKKIHFICLVILLSVAIVSCKKTKVQLVVHHADKQQPIDCAGDKSALLNEALHQFEEDISRVYDPESNLAYTAYQRFLYVGFSGTADYSRIVSQHALDIRKILVLEGVINDGGEKSNLNYKHPFVQCILDNIQDKDLVQTIRALLKTETMDPKLFNSRMQTYANKTNTDRYAALYIALDSYYQQLTMSELPQQELVTPAINE